jgi:hypothetical protein
VYQPIVDLVHHDVVGVEALARWPQLSINPDTAFRVEANLPAFWAWYARRVPPEGVAAGRYLAPH